MKTTKRLSALLLALLLVLGLTACGTKDSGTDTNTPTEQKKFSVGVTTGSTYTNEYFGFTGTLDGWTFLSSDELSQLTGQVVDILDDESISSAYASGSVVMEMYAGNDDGSQTANITVENLGEENGAAYNESKYVEATAQILPDQLSNAGYSDVSVTTTTVTFAGASHSGVYITGAVQGVELYETLVCIKVGNYVCTVTAASYLQDDTAGILEQFRAL